MALNRHAPNNSFKPTALRGAGLIQALGGEGRSCGTQNRKETNRMKPIIRSSQQGRTVSLVGDVYRFLATGEDTNFKYTLIEVLVSPGGGPPPHVHSREEE